MRGRESNEVSVSVIIPTRNEARNLPAVLAALAVLEIVSEVVIVDGGSTDGTLEVARAEMPDAVVLRQQGLGKGGALRQGIARASGDIVVTLDADGSAKPSEIPRFVEALVNGADVAKGSRMLPGGGSEDLTFLRRLGNSYLTRLVNVLFGVGYSDLCYGYNAFWRVHATALLPATDGFEVEAIIGVRAAQFEFRVAEVPSLELPRVHGMSNLSPIRDGFRIQSSIVRERMRGRRSVGSLQHSAALAAASVEGGPGIQEVI